MVPFKSTYALFLPVHLLRAPIISDCRKFHPADCKSKFPTSDRRNVCVDYLPKLSTLDQSMCLFDVTGESYSVLLLAQILSYLSLTNGWIYIMHWEGRGKRVFGQIKERCTTPQSHQINTLIDLE